MTNNNPQYNLDIDQMETYAQFLETLATASKAFSQVSDAAHYLNFNSHTMIQKYYESLSGICSGMNMLKQGFAAYAGSYNIDLEENFED